MFRRFRFAGVSLPAFAVSLVVPLVACAAPAPGEKAAVTLTEADGGTVRAVTMGSVVTVQLLEQGGTGFGWAADKIAGLDQLGEPEIAAIGQPMPGATERVTFRFKVTGTGRRVLRFHYSQPWKGGEKDARIVTFTLDAR
jgi:predicted secreted protein